jgi:hypothetical protein
LFESHTNYPFYSLAWLASPPSPTCLAEPNPTPKKLKLPEMHMRTSRLAPSELTVLNSKKPIEKVLRLLPRTLSISSS